MGKKQPLHLCKGDELKKFRQVMKKTLQADDTSSNSVWYHKKCKSDYIYANRTPDEKSKCRNLLADIYTDLYDYVQESVIDCHKPITTKFLYDNFMAICLSNKLDELLIPSHRTVVQHTLEHFKHGVKECLTSKKEGSISYDATIDPDMVPYLLKGDHDRVFLIRSADYMREILMNVKKNANHYQ